MSQPMTRAAILHEKYKRGELPQDDSIELPNPSLHPAWRDRAKVPSPPRLQGAPQVGAGGEIIAGNPQLSPSAAQAVTKLFQSPAVTESPTFKNISADGQFDHRIQAATNHMNKLFERMPEQAEQCFRRALNNSEIRLLIMGQLTEDVRDQLTETFL